MPNDTPISEQDLNEALVQMSIALARCKVRYAVVGGMGAGYRSQPRFTKDLDLLLTIPQLVLPGLLYDLQELGRGN